MSYFGNLYDTLKEKDFKGFFTGLQLPFLKHSKVNKYIYEAIRNNDKARTELLIDWRGNVNAQDEYGDTLLHHAAFHPNMHLVKRLIDSGADVNIQNREDDTPLSLTLTKMYYYGDNWGTPYIPEEYKNVIKFLIELDAHVYITNIKRKELLQFAMENSWVGLDFAKLIMKIGVDVNIQDEMGNTLLHNAINCRNADSVEFLVENGADLNIKNKDGKTPLNLAIARKYASLYGEGDLSILINETNINEPDNNGQTPLHLTLTEPSKFPHNLSRLIMKGANANIKNNDGQTPLNLALIRPDPSHAVKNLFKFKTNDIALDKFLGEFVKLNQLFSKNKFDKEDTNNIKSCDQGSIYLFVKNKALQLQVLKKHNSEQKNDKKVEEFTAELNTFINNIPDASYKDGCKSLKEYICKEKSLLVLVKEKNEESFENGKEYLKELTAHNTIDLDPHINLINALEALENLESSLFAPGYPQEGEVNIAGDYNA